MNKNPTTKTASAPETRESEYRIIGGYSYAYEKTGEGKGEQCVYCGKDSWTCEHFEPPILDGSESEGE